MNYNQRANKSGVYPQSKIWRSRKLEKMSLRKARKIFGFSLSLILINLTAIMERADENLLPSVYKEVSEAFHASPSQLGYLTFIRNFVQGIASPMAGVLVIMYDRPVVLAMGTFCWAISTAGVGVSQQFYEVALWRAVNGLGLAIVIPALQSFVADSYMEGVRGTGFGLVNLVGSLGGIGGGVLATLMAAHRYFGVEGWRFAFVMMASLSSIIGVLVFLFVDDPRRTSRSDAHLDERDELIKNDGSDVKFIWKESWSAMEAVMKVKTFQVIVLQGLVGSIPWTAMVFFTMWFELIGFSHKMSAALLSCFAIGCSLGALVGGVLADRISQTYPHSGRIMCAQFSAFMGIPYALILLKLISQSVSNFYGFATTLFMMGMTISWNGTAANAPMFAEVVPMKHRTMIYAFDRAFEVSFSSFAAPLVGILSEKVYGYNSESIDPLNGSPEEALALSKGLLTMMAVPFALCCLFYTPLYVHFRKDREFRRISEEDIT